MAFEAGNFNLFGLDLPRAWESFVAGWSEALQWKCFSWLNPQPSVRLLRPDGTTEWRRGASASPAPAGTKASPLAVLLPDEIVLHRELLLPDLLPDDVVKAAALDVDLNSPFPQAELAWGLQSSLADNGARRVRIALASRKHIAAYLESRPVDVNDVEIWAGEEEPVVLAGYRESLREQALVRRRGYVLAALGMLIALLLALAAAPWYVQRARVFDAQARHAGLEAAVASVVADREALLRSTAQLTAVRDHERAGADVLTVFARLTNLLPDDAYLTRLEVNGDQVRFSGVAVNAANLVETLGGHEEFRDVRTPAAISRTSDGKETFTVELLLWLEGARS